MWYAASPTLSLVFLSAALLALDAGRRTSAGGASLQVALRATAPCQGLAQESSPDRGKKESTGGDVEVRLYLIQKDRKPIDFKDMSAAIVIRPEKQRPLTRSMTLVQPREGEAVGGRAQTRELGPGYFVELRVNPAPSVEEERKQKPPAPAAEPPQRNGNEAGAPRERVPTLEEWRRDHVLRGPYFRTILRGDDVPRAFDASVTVRMGSTAFTSRDFRYPFAEPEPPEQILSRLEESVKKVADHMEKAEFGKISVVTVRMEDDLAKLVGLDSRDPEADIEYQRQWLVEVARKIDKASYTGNDDINALLKQFRFKLAQVRAALKGEPAPAPEKKGEAEKRPQDK